jgi:hypothetical protein
MGTADAASAAVIVGVQWRAHLVTALFRGTADAATALLSRGTRRVAATAVRVVSIEVSTITTAGQPSFTCDRWRPADGGKARTRAPDGRSYAAGMTASATTSSIACGWRSWRRRS